MTRKSKARFGMSRTYRINPTVKALRAALMASAVAASAVAMPALAALPYRDIAILEAPISGDAAVYNGADLATYAGNVAAGIVAYSNTDDAAVINSGDISAIANAIYSEYTGTALAAGIYMGANNYAVAVNNGTIDVSAQAASDGTAYAYGIAAGVRSSYVGDTASVQNTGDITVSAASQYGNAFASAINIVSYGDASVVNSGALSVTADVAQAYFGFASATAISVSSANLASAENTGDIYVSASLDNPDYGQWSHADAIGIEASGFDVTVSNSGDITAYADNDQLGGASSAIGITATAYNDITISNSGDISLAGSSGDGGSYFNWETYESYSGTLAATGLSADSYQGDVSIGNFGNITIVNNNPNGGYAGGFSSGDKSTGIFASSRLGNSDVHNEGDISITGGERAYGIIAQTTYVQTNYCNGNYCYFETFGGGDAYASNSGNIDISVGSDQLVSYAFGIVAGTAKYGGDATVVNSGNIKIQNDSYNADIYSQAVAIGIQANTIGKYSYGDASVANTGDIEVFTSGLASGIEALSTSNSNIINSGDIKVTSQTYRARGLYANADDYADVSNSGSITVSGGQSAIGILGSGDYGVTISNSGDLDVTATDYYVAYNYYFGTNVYYGGWAYGITAGSLFIGSVDVYNSGDIHVDAAVRGYGISTFARFGSTSVVNHGDISVAGHQTDAFGIEAEASGYYEFRYGEVGHTTVTNTGSISVLGISSATAISATQGYGDAHVTNSGDLTAHAEYGSAVGIASLTWLGQASVNNSGDISVSAGSNATAILAGTSGFYDYYIGNTNVVSSGHLLVSAEYGVGTGIEAYTQTGSVTVQAAGVIEVNASGHALGINARTDYGLASVSNHADIEVLSSTYNAVGIRAVSEYADVEIHNDGDISARADQLAQGIVALSYYSGVYVFNAGTVTAQSSDAYSQAVALRAAAGHDAVLYNEGSISAGNGNALAISITGGSGVIINHGDISGGILGDSGNDSIRNYAGARMFMDNDSVLLGYGENSFLNEGKLFVNGAANLVDMGYYGESGVGLFINNGHSIHMNDGAANDALVIAGDFSGSGDVNVDVNGANMNSDRLYIDGNVLAGTSNTINVNMIGLPSAAAMAAADVIDIVSVSGASSASNFVLGNVSTSSSALFTTDYSLVFSAGDYALAFEVTGLSQTGVLLSSVSPAIQGMWFNGLGTMFQRQGSERTFSPDGKAEVSGAGGVWARYSNSSGAMSPQAIRNNFGNGGAQAFDFDQSGIEAGVGYTFNSGWTIGVLGGNQDGSFKPDAGGTGRVDGNTLGAYLTYAPGTGFYADLSYRGFDFDGSVFSAIDILRIDGDAKGYSLEMGYGFKTASNLELEPQIQYSRVQVEMDDVAYDSGDFKLHDGDASQLRAGVAMRKAYISGPVTWKPYAALSYINSSSSTNRYSVGGALFGGVDTSGGSTLFEVGADARYMNWVFNAGMQMQDGGASDSIVGAQLNVLYSW